MTGEPSGGGFIEELVIGLIIAAIIAAFSLFNNRARRLLSGLLIHVRVFKAIRSSGISFFISSRDQYKLMKDRETIAAYLAHATKSLVYVGFWHAKGIEIENLSRTLTKLVEQGILVELVMLDPELENHKSEIMAGYLGISPSSLRSRLSESIKSFCEIKNSLPAEHQDKLVIRTHSEVIYASCFLLDYKSKSAKTLVDIKIFGAGRQNSFAMELTPNEDENSLYNRFTHSFLELRDKHSKLRH